MTTGNETPKEKSFQVVDKRRFDAAGRERTSTDEQIPVAGREAPRTDAGSLEASTETSSPSSFTISESRAADEAEPVAFTSFIMSLATQVLVQLGEMPPPQGLEIPIDLDSARQTIDIMTMLQRRTKGNLSAEETRFMEEVLHSLRISFINAKKKSA
jgi:hypothetical protein